MNRVTVELTHEQSAWFNEYMHVLRNLGLDYMTPKDELQRQWDVMSAARKKLEASGVTGEQLISLIASGVYKGK